MKYKAGVALKRKIVFPLFSTINVCEEKKKTKRERVNSQEKQNKFFMYSKHVVYAHNSA